MINSILLLFNMGPQEIILIALIVLLLFGGKKIPELMKGLGRGMREFNDAKNKVKTDIEKGMDEDNGKESKEPKKEVKGDKV
jgi:sec-independent protein translocase protein TatA